MMMNVLIVTAAIVLPLLTARLIVGGVEWAFWITGVAAVVIHVYLWEAAVAAAVQHDASGPSVMMTGLSSLSILMIVAALNVYSSKHYQAKDPH